MEKNGGEGEESSSREGEGEESAVRGRKEDHDKLRWRRKEKCEWKKGEKIIILTYFKLRTKK